MFLSKLDTEQVIAMRRVTEKGKINASVAVNAIKFRTSFSLHKMLVIKAGIHKSLDRVTNREDSDQTAS